MNMNIEKVSKNLIGVRFSWVEAGFISGFPFHGGKITNPYATLSTDGVIVLNKDSEFYEAFKKMLVIRVMKLTNDRLKLFIQALEAKHGTPDWDKYTESLLFLCHLEEKRRTLEPLKRRKGRKSCEV